MVTMKLFLKRVNVDRTETEEPNPTKKQLDTYMRKGKKYNKYLTDMYSLRDDVKTPTKIKYSDGGILSYELSPSNYKNRVIFPTADSVIDDIMEKQIEDGWSLEDDPFYYPTKKKYEGGYNEILCFIGCQNRKTITVKKKITKLEIKKRTEALKAVKCLPKNMQREIMAAYLR
jgi:hypothetical protein